jgi:hypothetical protein
MTARTLALGALIALAAALVLGPGAGPAVAAPAITITAPADGTTWDGTKATDFHVTGVAQTDSGGTITKVGVFAQSTDGGNHRYPPAANSFVEQQFGNKHQSEQYDIPLFPASNGKYEIDAVATVHNCNILTCGDATAANKVINITLAVPPAIPTGVKATLKDTVVTIEWTANSEEDALGYLVERSKNGGAYSCIGAVVQGTATSYKLTDDLKDVDGGNYKWHVVAYRGRDSTSKAPTCKEPGTGLKTSSAATATIPWKLSTTTTSAPGGSGGSTTTTTTAKSGTGGLSKYGGGASGAGGSTSTAKASKKPNLSALSGLSPVNNLARAPKLPTEADPGFNELLPFQKGAGDAPSDISGLPSTKLPADNGSGHTTTLLFVAAGLLVTVLSMHVLWLKAQVDRMPLEALTPEEIPLA